MTKLLLRLPWFASAPAIAMIAFAIAFAGNMFVGDYFVQTCENEVNLLTGEVEDGCGSGGDQSETPATGEPSPTLVPGDSTGTAGVVSAGTFQDGDPGHNGEGTAEIQQLADGSLNLRLANFSVTNGPDLFVYLSTDADGGVSEIEDLGMLTANNGNQNYAIPAGTDVSKFRSVVIWCKQFGVLFAFATLEPATVSVANTPTTEPATSTSEPASDATATPTPASGSGVSDDPTNTATTAPAASAATATPTPPPAPTATSVPDGPGVVASGPFRDGVPGHNGSGVAEVQRLADGSLNLRLANFSVTNGPDLIVYLSPDANDYVGGGLNLGDLKANNGNQNYAIPAGTDISQYASVVIWCRTFPTVFAIATLEVQ